MALFTTHSGSKESVDGNTYTVKIVQDLGTDPGTTPIILKDWNWITGKRGKEDNLALCESVLEFDVVVDSISELSAAFEAGEESIFAELWRGSALLGRGYLLSDLGNRPVENAATTFTLKAKGGLERLKNVDFDPIGDGVVTGIGDRMKPTEVLAYVFSKLAHNFKFYTASDLYAENIAGTRMTSGDPLDQSTVAVRRFYDSEADPPEGITEWPGAPVSCRDALMAMCDTQNNAGALRRVWQEAGAWHVVDYALLAESSYTRRRYAISSQAPSFEVEESHTPTQRTLTLDSDWVRDSAYTTERNEVRSATVDYQHGPVPNLIPDPDFDQFTAGEPDFWTPTDAGFTGDQRLVRDGNSGLSLDNRNPNGTFPISRGSTFNRTALDPKGYRLKDAYHPEITSGTSLVLSVAYALKPTSQYYDDNPSAVAWSGMWADVVVTDGVTTWFATNEAVRHQRRDHLSQPVWDNSGTTTPLFLGTNNAFGDVVELSFELAPTPATGDVYLILYGPMSSGEYIDLGVWDRIALDVADEEGKQKEAKRFVRTQAVEAVDLDPVSTPLGDGPSDDAPGSYWLDGRHTVQWYRGVSGSGTLERGDYQANHLVHLRQAKRLIAEGRVPFHEVGFAGPVRFSNILSIGGAHAVPNYTKWNGASGETTGQWVERAVGSGATTGESSAVSISGGFGTVRVAATSVQGVTGRTLTQADNDASAHTSSEIAAGVEHTSIPVQSLPEGAFRDNDEIMIIDARTLHDHYATVNGSPSTGATSIPVDPVTFDAPIAPDSPVIPTRNAIQRALIQAEKEIILRSTAITIDSGVLQSQNWDGTIDDTASPAVISDPGTVGWAISEGGEATFEGVFARDFLEAGNPIFDGQLTIDEGSGEGVTLTALTDGLQLDQQDGGGLAALTLGALTYGEKLESDLFAPRQAGAQITDAGVADLRKLYVDELVAKVFTADLTQALAGSDFLTKSVTTLAADFTVPTQGNTATLTVHDLPGQKGAAAFAAGDWIRLRVVDNSGGGLVIVDAWGTVASYVDNTDGTQDWTFTRKDADVDADGRTVGQNAAALDYGQAGDAVIRRSVEGGTPLSDIRTWETDPMSAANYSTLVFHGDLSAYAGDAFSGLTGAGAVLEDNIYIGEKAVIGGQTLHAESFAVDAEELWPFGRGLVGALAGRTPNGFASRTETAYGLISSGTDIQATLWDGGGVAVERAITNVLSDPLDLTGASWTENGVSTASVTGESLLAGSATRVTDNTTGSNNRIEQGAGTFTGSSETLQVWISDESAGQVGLVLFDASTGTVIHGANFDFSSGTWTTTDGSPTLRARRLPGGWMLALTGGGTSGNTREALIYPTGRGSSGSGSVVIHGAQLIEEGFPFSFVDGAKSAGRLSYDVPRRWWERFTMICRARSYVGSLSYLWGAGDIVALRFQNTRTNLTIRWEEGGVQQTLAASVSASDVEEGAVAAVDYDGSTLRLFWKGKEVASQSGVALEPTGKDLAVGQFDASRTDLQLDGVVEYLAFFPGLLSASDHERIGQADAPITPTPNRTIIEGGNVSVETLSALTVNTGQLTVSNTLTMGANGEITNTNSDFSITETGIDVAQASAFALESAYTINEGAGRLWGSSSRITLSATGSRDLSLYSSGGDVRLQTDAVAADRIVMRTPLNEKFAFYPEGEFFEIIGVRASDPAAPTSGARLYYRGDTDELRVIHSTGDVDVLATGV